MKRIPIFRLLPSLIVAVSVTLIAMHGAARKVKTTHKAVKIQVRNAEDESTNRYEVSCDTTSEWRVLADKIRFSGFDKTPSSSKESFFISNLTDSILVGLTVDMVYTDMSGRVLHERETTIECDVPGGETRRVDIATWDLQHAFRHYRCPATRRATTPFRVKINPVTLVFRR